jgi:16S rRNA (cytosine1407-C5)-methyltransferase
MKQHFLERTSLALNVSVSQAEQLLSTQYTTAIRINPLKHRKSTINNLKSNFKQVIPISWADNCYYVNEGQLKASQMAEFLNGEIIIQNPASFIPVLELNPKANEQILDMCSAPGGKSSHISALTNNKASLTLNDTSRTRFFKMQKLMANMGVTAYYSLKDGRYLSKEYGSEIFDKILLDAPCSGEANLNISNLNKWRLSTIKRLSNLQCQLIKDAYKMLKPGGLLVYSTCTIAPEENEQVISYLLKHNPSAQVLNTANYPLTTTSALLNYNGNSYHPQVKNCLRLIPSTLNKPFFIAKITKQTTTSPDGDDSYQRLKNHYKQVN